MKYMFLSLFFTFFPRTLFFFFASVHVWEVALEACPETRVGHHAKMSRTLLRFNQNRNGSVIIL